MQKRARIFNSDNSNVLVVLKTKRFLEILEFVNANNKQNIYSILLSV